MDIESDARALLVVTNRNAGTAHDDAVDAALRVLRAGAEMRVEACDSTAHLHEILDGRRPGERLVTAGGDGSLHTLATVLATRDALSADDPVGVVPLGTGNDLARCLGLPLDPAAAAAVVLEGRPRALDVLVDDGGTVVVNAVHVGVGAQAADEAGAWKERLGVAGYAVGSAVAGARAPGWRLRVEVDGAVVRSDDEPVLMVAVAVGSSIGGGAPLAPDAVPDDGLADVVIVGSTGPLARIGFAAGLRDGDHVERDDVVTMRGRAVRVSTHEADGFPGNADGEVAGPFRERTWALRSRAWSLLVP